MRLFKLIVALFTSITITNAANAAEVKMAKANWDTGYFQAEIYKQALEAMGHTVTEPKAIKPSVFYVAAAAGDLDLGLMDGLELTMVTSKKPREKLKPLVT